VLPNKAIPAVALVCDMFIIDCCLADHCFNSAVYLTGPCPCPKTLLSSIVNTIDSATRWPLLHCVLRQWLFFLEIFANSLYRLIRLDHWGVIGTGSLFNLLVVLPHFIRLAVFEPVRPFYSN
jgi:hypothetical protein